GEGTGRRRPNPQGSRDPSARGGGVFERSARQDALGHRADREVPPEQHLPQAWRGEPHRGESLGAVERPTNDRSAGLRSALPRTAGPPPSIVSPLGPRDVSRRRTAPKS